MLQQLPLTEATGEEIVCRTTYQIILIDYRTNPNCYDNPATRLLDLSLQYHASGIHLIADSLQDAAIHCSCGNTIASWRTLHTVLDKTRQLALARLGRSRRR